MPSRRVSGKASGEQQEAEPLLVCGDGLRPGYLWRVDEYGAAGALTKPQRDQLCAILGLTEDQVVILSMRLGNALDQDAQRRFVPIDRKKAAKKATKTLKSCDNNFRRAAVELTTSLERIESLSIEASDHPKRAAELETVRAKTSQMLLDIADLRSCLDDIVDYDGVAHDLSSVNRTQVPDVRRQLVLETLFQAWAEAGKSLTFTTDPVTSSRKGALIDFVRMTTGFLIDPAPRKDLSPEEALGEVARRASAVPPVLSAETIVEDLKKFRETNTVT